MLAARIAVAGALTACAVGVAACGSNPSTGPASATSTGSGTAASAIPTVAQDSALHDALPAKIRSAGTMISVNSGSFPPYLIVGADGKSETGAAVDIGHALGQLLGVTVSNTTVDGFPSELLGIDSGRYDFALGPVGDFKARQTGAEFVDWVKEHVVFAVPEGNPKKIDSLSDVCGLRISVQAGGSAETVVNAQSKTCTSQGKAAVQVLSFKDQPTALLAVNSGRADAFFSSQAPLTYFTQHSDGKLQLAGVGQANGFQTLYQGAVVPKSSSLGSVLEQAFTKLVASGVYEKIMQKWGLDANVLTTPGINLALS